MVRKETGFGGTDMKIPLRYGTTAGGSANFANALANVSPSKYAAFLLTRFTDYAVGQISGESIRATKGDQNAFIERFNRTYRDEVLDAYVFASLTEVQTLTDDWLLTYNHRRPHDALGRIPPTRFLPRPLTPSESTYAPCP
jgi:hypothetical protein